MKLLPILIIISLPTFAQVKDILPNSDVENKFRAAKIKFHSFEKEHGHFLETRNIRMHYLTWGDPKNTPLIWLHGSVSTGYEILPMADKLVQKGYYVIAPDYYGHGQTSIPNHEVSLYHVADDISDLMIHLKIDKAIIGGWSRGGFIASAFYDAYPEKVLALILEDGGSVATNTNYHKMDSAQLVQKVKGFADQIIPDTTYSTELEAYSAFLDKELNENQFELLTWIRKNDVGKWVVGPGLWKLFNMSNTEQSMENILRPTLSPLFAESMSIIEPKIIYRNLQIPILILDPTSSDDLFPFENENAALKSHHPNLITHKILNETGHNVHYEKPDDWLREVLSFLGRFESFWK
ncbi:alpha/beta hydrolase [Dyadobacter sp. CY345]|uniref:alpha/beta fold hydrolase n=1 Tax=Dyadobacter sp. CY345 TaxID=2909335 RepID=UPI001F3772BF|nr:alpha/beta hydrolase [Dyadobacter sp. CY345]MCF2446515.1 alpha/beta hydrolase [Dyadobacter sp. CY345]